MRFALAVRSLVCWQPESLRDSKKAQRVRPETMVKRYDLVVIGSGTAAMVAAMRVRDARLAHRGDRFPPVWRYLRASRLRSEEDAHRRGLCH